MTEAGSGRSSALCPSQDEPGRRGKTKGSHLHLDKLEVVKLAGLGGSLVEELNLEVHWGTQRVVQVHVDIQALADAESEKLTLDWHPVLPIGIIVLDSLDSLKAYLADATRNEPDGGRVEAMCLEPDARILLEVLGVQGPPPNPIDVYLPESA